MREGISIVDAGETEEGQTKTRIQRQNEEKIIDAALEVFGRYGFRGTTLDQIAERADISKPNLLYYFKSKQGLYIRALNRVLDIWLLPLESLDPDGDPKAELGYYIDQKLQMSRDYPEASRLYASEMIEGARVVKPILETRLAELTRNKKSTIAKWTRQGKMKKVDALHLLFMIWAVTQHYADFAVQVETQTGKTLKDDRFFEGTKRTIKQIIFNGIFS